MRGGSGGEMAPRCALGCHRLRYAGLREKMLWGGWGWRQRRTDHMGGVASGKGDGSEYPSA